jgi:hypothetical protein
MIDKNLPAPKLDAFCELLVAMMQEAVRQGIAHSHRFLVMSEDQDRMALYSQERPGDLVVLSDDLDKVFATGAST